MQSILDELRNEDVKELAPEGLIPVPGTETEESMIYFSPPAVKVGQEVDFNIRHCERNNMKTSYMPVGKIKMILPGGRVLIQGISEKGLYNRVFVSCDECAAGLNGDNTCKIRTYSGCFSEPLVR